MSARALEEQLRELGHTCRVEARERLAVICLEGDLAAALACGLRDDALRLAVACGFTSVAVEISSTIDVDAPLSGD